MRWTRDALILHFWWGWQFVIACLIEGATMFWIGYSDSDSGSQSLGVMAPYRYLYQIFSSFSRYISSLELKCILTNYSVRWLFFTLTLVLVITVVGEICAYANEELSPNQYLLLQIGKLSYVSLVFGLVVGVLHPSLDHETHRGHGLTWEVTMGIFLFWYVLLSFCS